jgi:hypothetical protein
MAFLHAYSDRNQLYAHSPEKYKHKILAVVCECYTMRKLEVARQRTTNKPIPAVPASFAWIITKINKATQSVYVIV